ncbi:MAG: hypothetical protein OER77_08700 [Myxococcales bacterium]|nr:hypothetical protein [Myxococcales bacterium]
MSANNRIEVELVVTCKATGFEHGGEAEGTNRRRYTEVKQEDFVRFESWLTEAMHQMDLELMKIAQEKIA